MKKIKKYQNGGQKKQNLSQYSTDSLSVAKNWKDLNNFKKSPSQLNQAEDNLRSIAEKYSNDKIKSMGPAGKKLAATLKSPDYYKKGGSVKSKSSITSTQKKSVAITPSKKKK